jgi:type II secretory pathway pseudopilin PulG
LRLLTRSENGGGPHVPDAADVTGGPPGEDIPGHDGGAATATATHEPQPINGGAESAPLLAELPTRVCPHCAALSITAGDFCPHCGSQFSRPARSGFSTRAKVATATVLVLLVLGAAGVAVAIKLYHDSQVAAQHGRAVAAAHAAAKAQAAQQAQQQTEAATRQTAEQQLQTDITNDATKKLQSGLLINGPISNTTCTPVSGGSSTNLSQSTGTYNCLAVYQTNSDGTSTGYHYTGTIDFNSGMLSWQLGGGS